MRYIAHGDDGERVDLSRVSDLGAGIWFHPADRAQRTRLEALAAATGQDVEAVEAMVNVAINAEDAATSMAAMASRARQATRTRERVWEELQNPRSPIRTRQYLDDSVFAPKECEHTSFYRMGHWRCASCNTHLCVDAGTQGGDCDHNVVYDITPMDWHRYRRPQGIEDLP